MEGRRQTHRLRLSRRDFLKLSGLLAGILALNPSRSWETRASSSKPKVVHTYCARATDWDFSATWWGGCVDQAVVQEMVDRGVMELTGRTTRVAAWQALIPDYVPGQRVAIKVNLNNADSQTDSDNEIDALIEPVNAVVTGLKEIGVAESDIWVYDAIKPITDRLQDRCEFPSVRFSGGWGTNPQGFSSTEKVTFATPPGHPSLADQRISNVLVNADYLINMPIMKKHCCAWVTLSFKNHFGSIENCAALHGYTFPYETNYTPAYNPMVDIYKNPHFLGKTVLTIADGLYGSKGDQASVPQPWTTFGNQAPNSMFFSRDPVAIDSVMYDFLETEAGVNVGGDDYLALAAQQGLGVFEHRAPGTSDPDEWYSQIRYLYADVDTYVRLNGRWRDGTAHLSWNKPLHPDLAGCRVCYSSDTGADVDQGSSPINIADPDQLAIDLTGLTMYSLYHFWLEPYESGGEPLVESNHVPILPTDILYYLPLALAG
ncbi:MAG: DUF362 domain-containing protein [Anaerolineae bacterium]|nr:DUF362 domain-containing protein [Anaerolineae bacterium]NIN99691.1 DUF362 domain-containing protein [Anaerolineae bacterium]NIQ82544.1 DUF362 domain-containing protein [Anaerolineae bacterium]